MSYSALLYPGKYSEIPDDPAGVTYRNIANWTDGVEGWTCAGTTAIVNGILKFTSNTNNFVPLKNISYAHAMIIMHVRTSRSGTFHVRNAVAGVFSGDIPCVGGQWFPVIIADSGAATTQIQLTVTGADSVGDTIEVRDIYVGTGAYLHPITDLTPILDEKSIKRTSRLYSALKPNTNKCELRTLFDPSVQSTLLLNDEISCVIKKDGADFFWGVFSPNYSTTIQAGQKYLNLTVEDYSISRLGQTIATTLAYFAKKVCDPADPANSLVHIFAALAGVTLAAGCPTISTVVPYLIINADDKKTYADILSAILFDYNYCYRFDESGNLVLDVAVNLGTITPAITFNASADGGNIRSSYEIKKTREQYDDIRVKYDSVELKSGIVLFQDTSGASGSLPANIELKPTGDTSEKDYYPSGSKDGEVYSEWANPDGLTIVAAMTAALDTTVGGGITLDRALTNYYRRASFAYRNTSAISSYITKLRIIGDAYAKTAENTARSSVVSGKRLLEYTAKYVFSTADAQALAQRLENYYKHSCHTYTLKSQQDTDLGAYVALIDTLFAGISQKCRVVSRIDDASTKSITYELESVADFETVTIITEGRALPSSASSGAQVAAMADDGVISPQEKKLLSLMWQSINGDGATTGSYWSTRSAAVLAKVSTLALDNARNTLYGLFFTSPAILADATWNNSVPVASGTLEAAFADYYRVESATIATTARFAAYALVTAMDCGEYDGTTPGDNPELDGGQYTATGAFDPPLLYLDCGEY